MPTYGRTVVVAVAVLLLLTGSLGETEVTVAVFVMIPFWVGFTTMVTVAVARAANEPRLQVTTFLWRVQVPWVVATDPNPVVFGSVSVSDTPVAESGPLFFTGIV